MELNNIEQLLEKYNNAETTILEEQKLKTFFSKDNVPAHLEHYKTMFGYFSNSITETYNAPLPLKQEKFAWYKWFAVAAVIAISAGVYTNSVYTSEDFGTYKKDQTQLAYNQFVKSLELVSKNFNKGTSSVTYLETFNTGLNNVNYLNEMQNPIGRIIKIKN